jgi:hypothetical protein
MLEIGLTQSQDGPDYVQSLYSTDGAENSFINYSCQVSGGGANKRLTCI